MTEDEPTGELPAAENPPSTATGAAQPAVGDAAAPVAEAPPSPAVIGPVSDVVLAPPEAPTSAPSTPRVVTPVPLAWRSWPVVDSPLTMLLVVGVLVGAPGIIYDAAGLPYAILAAAALLTVLWRDLIPTQFELSALGVTEAGPARSRRIPWISIDRYVVGRRGVFLSSAGAPLEMLRGLYIPFGPNREQILSTLRYYLPRAETVER